MADLTITHSPEDGTQLHGSAKGDGVLDIVRGHHFTWKRGRGIHVQNSRDTIANRDHLDRCADALRAAGHNVTVEVDQRWRPMEEREADRADRSEARSERLDERADKAATRSQAARAASDRISDHIPFGQPILVGHHSEGRARRDAARIHASMRKSIDEANYAGDLARRADAAAAHMRRRNDPRVTMRRIETLEADARQWQRRLDDATPGSNREEFCRLSGEQVADEIRYWRAHLAQHAHAETFVAWGPEHFRKGDEVRVLGRWLPVRRVNKKSVSVPGAYGGAQTGNDASWSETATWDMVAGRRRDGEQLDKPNGEPWPVELARKVAKWHHLAHVASLPAHEYDDEGRHVRWAVRLVHGLDLDASAQEVEACQPAADDVAGQRDLAAAYLAAHARLAAGESVPDIKATLTVWDGAAPAWRLPTDREPLVVRVDEAHAGDLVKGIYEQGGPVGGGNMLRRWFCGPIRRVIGHTGDTYSGERFIGWWTVELTDGTTRKFKPYDRLAVFRAEPRALAVLEPVAPRIVCAVYRCPDHAGAEHIDPVGSMLVRAEQIGRQAHADGLPDAPGAHPQILAMVAGWAVGDGAAAVFKAFSVGYGAGRDAEAARVLGADTDPWAGLLDAAAGGA